MYPAPCPSKTCTLYSLLGLGGAWCTLFSCPPQPRQEQTRDALCSLIQEGAAGLGATLVLPSPHQLFPLPSGLPANRARAGGGSQIRLCSLTWEGRLASIPGLP